MPYITQEKRNYLDFHIENIHHAIVDLEMDAMGDPDSNNTEGNLNYTVTRLLHLVYGNRDATRYAQINDAVGLLECIKQEFYRKVAGPYEDQKEFENGEIVGKQVLVEEEVTVEMTSQEEQDAYLRSLEAGDPPVAFEND